MKIMNMLFLMGLFCKLSYAVEGERCLPSDEIYVNYGHMFGELSGSVKVKSLAYERIKELVREVPDSARTLSPNEQGAFYLSSDGQRKDLAGVGQVVVYLEKPNKGGVAIQVPDDYQSLTAKWINDEILLVDVWWGRIAETQVIVDVSSRAKVYSKDIDHNRLTAPACQSET